MKFKKLNTKGFSHDFLVLAFVVIFAIVGVGYLVASHAATTTYTSTNEFPKFQYVLGSGTTAALTHANTNDLLLQFNKGVTGYHASDMALYQFNLPANTTASSITMNVSYVDAGYDTVFLAAGSPSTKVWSVSTASTQTNKTVTVNFSNKPTVIYFGISAKGSSGGFSGSFPANRNLTLNSYTLTGTTTTQTPTVSLSANPTSVNAGGTSTLTWSSTNATSCTASGAWSGNQATSGSVSTGNLSTTSTYTLACSGTGGTASANAMVTVAAPQQSGGGGGGNVTWLGSFDSGTVSTSIFGGPGTKWIGNDVSVITDPLGSGAKVAQFTVPNADQTCCGTPRADLESPILFKPGSDAYVAIPVLIPASLPSISGSSNPFLQVGEIYGPPYGGSPTIGLDVSGTNGSHRLSFEQDADEGYAQPWTSPVVDGQWHTVIFHVHFATDNTGFVQLWYDGVQQKFTNGSTQINYPTLVSGINWDGSTGDFVDINMYREANMFSVGTIYHGAPAVGPTLQSVEGALNSPTGP